MRRSRRPPVSAEEVPLKPLFWVGTSHRDLVEMPETIKDGFGYGLFLAQRGEKDESAKPLAGFGGAGVLELRENHDGDTYRAVYTVRFSTGIYVLHVFQKRSKSGIATPAHEIDVVRNRLRAVEEFHAQAERTAKGRKEND